MKCNISDTRNSKKAFAVIFLSTPQFPIDRPIKEGVHYKAVIAANDDEGAWGFVTLTEEEKICIGNAMLEFGASVEQWLWCELYR